LSHRFDRRALPLADAHYNRQKPGSPQFVPPGRCVVLLTPGADALWVSSWPFSEFTKHAWAGSWVNSLFRNESPHLSSDLIREAVAATRSFWEPPKPHGMVTFIDRRKTRSKRDTGYCYLMAGWEPCGRTAGGLYALRQTPDRMPSAVRPKPMGGQLELEAA
jgi:hypothetical protein